MSEYEEFWNNMTANTRFKCIKGLNPYAYAVSYKDLTKREKLIVQKFVKSTKE